MKQKIKEVLLVIFGSFIGYCIWFTIATQLGII